MAVIGLIWESYIMYQPISRLVTRQPGEAGGGKFKFPPQAAAAAETFIAALHCWAKVAKVVLAVK